MKVTDAQSVMLLAVRRDGSDGTGDALRCTLCRKALVEFVASPGLRRLRPALAERTTVCVNTTWTGSIPCPAALRAKPILDAILSL